jgi:ATP-binding cassette subfamily C protein
MNHCTVQKLIAKALQYKRALLRGNLLAIAATLLTVTIPLFIPVLVDELLLHKSSAMTGWVAEHIVPMSVTGYLTFFLVLTLVMRGIGVVLNVAQVKTFLGVSRDISLGLRTEALGHLERVSLAEYETIAPGAVTSKLVTDVGTVDQFIGTTVSKFIISILTLLFTAIVLLLIHWKLALFILITNPVVVFFTAKLARNVGRLKRQENQATEVFQSTLGETLELFHQVRAANKERYFFGRIAEQAVQLKERSIAFGYRSDRAIRVSFLVFLGGYEVFRAVSIWVVAYSDLSVGLMLAIFGYLWIMMTPTQEIIGFQYALANAKGACQRINAIFAMRTEPVVDEGVDPFAGKSSVGVAAEKLSFGYSDDNEILKRITLDISPGASVAIVGSSGSGKTTLANILAGFYPPSEGEILYDGIPHTQVAPSTVRQGVHMILQHPKLFNDTMRFNLTLGDDYSDEVVARAVRVAQLDEVITRLPEGLDTLVGKDGVRLSGGQRQRVAIARMILLDPAVVIFDESTSALDVHTEAKLFADLHAYLAPKTVITIAHRLSTIEQAEYIYVLEEGRLVDEGTPETLMAKDESYFANMT